MGKGKIFIDGVEGGTDSMGNTYYSRDEMWKNELDRADPTSEKGWYGKGIKYWEDVPASVDGVLGGFGHVSASAGDARRRMTMRQVTDVDLEESELFYQTLLREGHLKLTEPGRAADCGAGIGRISKGFLCNHFKAVDLVEPVAHFLQTAEKELSGFNDGNYIQIGLQDWVPQQGLYDVIWIQWVIGHLTDEDFVAFMMRCKRGLKEDGVIVLKENACTEGFIVDKVKERRCEYPEILTKTMQEDSSVTRSAGNFAQFPQFASDMRRINAVYLEGLCKAAGLSVVAQE
ncbi:hypothetical protein GUITHDRAFT_110071 [Guillardia theta CCMP2712]|uniref:Alpha N-terminal protein methyltransferase 1 n=1 Tax=Guillardia theta (strain CCMP2712) TaxID=905079 RepID=L1J788_GUITC|nr:hypothetical protein GUITHDRAFT_110071 [Guillardia theta CCMP2712]EKX43964.1 hypothetical protein GUITHDRAFT_110071 [Guillardia theta CCMP2712]|eukprot:XP_005830944.1 hypothetical protein GUITHDRAFT_110071 [Guillardia theta CCMP2712]